jgi:hypothetical protein
VVGKTVGGVLSMELGTLVDGFEVGCGVEYKEVKVCMLRGHEDDGCLR